MFTCFLGISFTCSKLSGVAQVVKYKVANGYENLEISMHIFITLGHINKETI